MQCDDGFADDEHVIGRLAGRLVAHYKRRMTPIPDDVLDNFHRG